MNIKAKQLCRVVGMVTNSWMNDRVVETVRYEGTTNTDSGIVLQAWIVNAPWASVLFYVNAKHLQPITDPDMDVSDQNETKAAA